MEKRTCRKRIPNALRKHRRLADYTQAQAAKKLGVNSRILKKWECGLAMPGGRNLLKLGKLYGVLPNALYFEVDQEVGQEISLID